MKKSFLQKFEDKIFYGSPCGCWYWVGAVNSGGYGAFGYCGKVMPAHRVSYILFKDHIPDGLNVCHECDNILCVNPFHLFLGTQTDNMRDCVSKGRIKSRTGENNNTTKLTDAQVIEIRSLALSGVKEREIIKHFPVKRATINKIIHRKLWKHI